MPVGPCNTSKLHQPLFVAKAAKAGMVCIEMLITSELASVTAHSRYPFVSPPPHFHPHKHYETINRPDPTTELPILYDAVYLTRGAKTGWVPGPKTGLEVGRFLLLFEFILMWIHRIESVDFLESRLCGLPLAIAP